MLDFRFIFDVLNEEQKSLVALMKDFCEREIDRKALRELADKPIPPNATKKDMMDRIPWDLVSKAHDLGLRQLTVPKEYGGGGYKAEWLTMHALAEAAGYYGGLVGRLFTSPWWVCAQVAWAPKSVKDEFFPAFMKNRKTLAAVSTTEPNHGSNWILPYDDPSVGQVFAYKDKNDWIVNGEKQFSTGGGQSDYVLLSARTDKNASLTKAATSFMCPTNIPGFKIRRVNDMAGNELPANVQITFENARIPDRLRTTPVNGTFEVRLFHHAWKTIHIATFLGDDIREWENVVDYAKKRVQGGKPIIQHPNIGMEVAEGTCLLRTLRLLLYQNAWDWNTAQDKEKGTVDPAGWSYLNWWYKKVIFRLIELGLDIYGGMAPQKELSFEGWARRKLSGNHGGAEGLLNLFKVSKHL